MKILLPNPKTFIYATVLYLSAVLTSCLDGSYEQFFPQTELGLVRYTSDSSSWYILNDANLKLWPKNAESVETRPEHNARVLVHFNVLSGDVVPGYDYVIALAYMAKINVYDVTPTSAADIAANPSDTLRNVDAAWVGSHYLNVDYYFFYNTASAQHEVSLLRDTTVVQSDSVKLFLRHDSKGDKGVNPHQNIVSFDLESLHDAVQTDTVNINFEVECIEGSFRRSFVYKFNKH
ncbi:MAG: hypothetical protein LBF67_05545 [Prevotellaceae bacterium]|jgi:hypothetical protein|nr:hypothetical protein [Prevotellaceae bacterium]